MLPFSSCGQMIDGIKLMLELTISRGLLRYSLVILESKTVMKKPEAAGDAASGVEESVKG